MTAKVDKLEKALKHVGSPGKVVDWNKVLKEKGRPYLIVTDKQRQVFIKNMEENSNIPTDAYILKGGRKSKNFDYNVISTLAEMAGVSVADMYSELGLFEGGIYARHVIPKALIIASSLGIIGLSTFKITGNAIADSTKVTDYTMFGLLIILIIAFTLFIRKKEKKK